MEDFNTDDFSEDYLDDNYGEPVATVEDEGSGDDPWAWAEDLDPSNVQKTWNQYTQTRQELAEERRAIEQRAAELQQIEKLRDEIYADPGLVNTIEGYMTTQRPADRVIHDLQSELGSLKARVETDKEYDEVREWIEEQGYKPVSKRELIEHAVQTGAGSLMSAYKDMTYEQAQEAREEKIVDGIKRSRGAKSVRTKKPDASGGKTFSSADIKSMSDEDFEKNYGAIANQFKKK